MHLHCMVLDGVYRRPDGEPVFAEAPAPTDEELQALLHKIMVGEAVQRYTPDCASIEIVLVNVNPQSTRLPGQARGACSTALLAAGLPLAE